MGQMTDRELASDDVVPLNLTAHFSIFQPNVLVFFDLQLQYCGSVLLLSSIAGSCFQYKSSYESTVRCLPSTAQHTDKVSDQLVNVAEQLAAEEPNIPLRSW